MLAVVLRYIVRSVCYIAQIINYTTCEVGAGATNVRLLMVLYDSLVKIEQDNISIAYANLS